MNKIIPSNVSVVAAVKRKKQAISNVLFSFLTCVLGAQVIRYRYMKDDLEDEINLLQKKYDQAMSNIEEKKLTKLCNDMNVNEKQKNILFSYFQPSFITNANDNSGIATFSDESASNGIIGDDNKSNSGKDVKPVKSFRI